jgi:tRNA(Arg) A34 adenosine deaminase TadA
MDHAYWMNLAIEQARAGIATGQSPFGAVIVRGEKVIAAGHNQVWQRCDPTAHAEVVTIQKAAAELASIDLTGCTMYTTCEPCPMCAAAIHWARLDTVYAGARIADAQRAGFAELTLPAGELYRLGGSPVRMIGDCEAKRCAALFDEWLRHAGHRAY